MDSQFIKLAVAQLNYILNSNDKNLANVEIKQAANEFVSYLIQNFCNAPTTAVALIQCLNDRQFDLDQLDPALRLAFKQKFQYKLCDLSPTKLEQLRKISNKIISG